MSDLAKALEDLSTTDGDIAEIFDYIRATFPTYEQAIGAMGQRESDEPRAADSSLVRVKVDPVTTARVK